MCKGSGSMAEKAVFVTGGVGFIGSHTVLALLENGYRVTIIDNFDNAFDECFARMQRLAGDKAAKMKLIKGDLRNFDDIDAALATDKFDAVVHFAGRKAVGESVSQPMLYYTHNVAAAVNLIEAMRKHSLKNIVFSSSATVYGNPEYTPLDEKHRLQALNPYGRSKLIIEDMLRDLFAAEQDWRIVLLRYFNPVGAHPSGEIGEHPVGIPNNLMPYVHQVALGQREALGVFGDDYDTPDGTGVRDYIHVVDLAAGHVSALKNIESRAEPFCDPINLGTGRGTSVLEMVKAFEEASGRTVKYEIKPRRPGDAAAVWAATETAEQVLGWTAKRDIKDMCRDQWNWASTHPDGYGRK